jgi:hypothetical protein
MCLPKSENLSLKNEKVSTAYMELLDKDARFFSDLDGSLI